MDYEADFRETVRSTVALLLARGKRPGDYTYDGGTVTGWIVERSSYSTEAMAGTSSMEERWGHTYTILATDASFWEVGEDRTESMTRKTQTQSRRRLDSSRFVGTTGKPFSRMKATLERLPYR